MRNVHADIVCVVDQRVDLDVVCFVGSGGEELFVPEGEGAFCGEDGGSDGVLGGGGWCLWCLWCGESGGAGGEEEEY